MDIHVDLGVHIIVHIVVNIVQRYVQATFANDSFNVLLLIILSEA